MRTQSKAPPPPSRAANTGHFDGSTTYGNAFVGHALEARAAAPAPQARPQGKFEGRSAYQDSFVPHSIEPRCVAALRCAGMYRIRVAFLPGLCTGPSLHSHLNAAFAIRTGLPGV